MPDTHPAEQVVRRYIECSGTLDAQGLAACFSPDAGLNGFLGAQAVAGSADLYIKDVQRMAGAGTDMSAYKAAVTAFDATGGIATATVSMEGFAGMRFVDYLHLVQRDGEWRIVSKTFTTL